MAAKQSIASRAQALAEPVAQRLGLAIWETEYVKEGASYFLRYYIDREGGVTIDDCEAFSREIDPLLDEADFIQESYYLEVSSPGVERRLSTPAHFAACQGQMVRVRLIRAQDGRKEWIGRLQGYADGWITLETDEGSRQFEQSAAAWVRVYDDTL